MRFESCSLLAIADHNEDVTEIPSLPTRGHVFRHPLSWGHSAQSHHLLGRWHLVDSWWWHHADSYRWWHALNLDDIWNLCHKIPSVLPSSSSFHFTQQQTRQTKKSMTVIIFRMNNITLPLFSDKWLFNHGLPTKLSPCTKKKYYLSRYFLFHISVSFLPFFSFISDHVTLAKRLERDGVTSWSAVVCCGCRCLPYFLILARMHA